MAGNYPDAPSWRMAYDRDGTIAVQKYGAITTQFTNANLVTLNDETNSTVSVTNGDQTYIAFLFPEPRDVDGFFVLNSSGSAGSGASLTPEVSANTTNGEDGTWTSVGSPFNPVNNVLGTRWRTDIISASSLGVRGIRFKWTAGGSSANVFNPAVVHLYGEITAGQSLDRLMLWHPTLDERVPPAYFDWGDVPRSTTASRDFRVKNVSPAATANTVRVAMESLTDAAPSVPAQHALAIGGGTYLAQQTIATLAAGAISDVLTLRRTTPSNAQLGLNAFRVFAEPASWS